MLQLIRGYPILRRRRLFDPEPFRHLQYGLPQSVVLDYDNPCPCVANGAKRTEEDSQIVDFIQRLGDDHIVEGVVNGIDALAGDRCESVLWKALLGLLDGTLTDVHADALCRIQAGKQFAVAASDFQNATTRFDQMLETLLNSTVIVFASFPGRIVGSCLVMAGDRFPPRSGISRFPLDAPREAGMIDGG